MGILWLMVYASHSPNGGLAVGLGVFGRAVWIQRQAVCHRWRVWRTRTPDAGITCGDLGDGLGPAGVREPRRPLPGGLGAEGLVDLGDH
jgi:hypothetical protein